jgi:hypothetical protein
VALLVEAVPVAGRALVVDIPPVLVADPVVDRVKAGTPVALAELVLVADPVVDRAPVVALAVAQVVPVGRVLEVDPAGSAAHRGAPVVGVVVATRKSCSRNT